MKVRNTSPLPVDFYTNIVQLFINANKARISRHAARLYGVLELAGKKGVDVVF